MYLFGNYNQCVNTYADYEWGKCIWYQYLDVQYIKWGIMLRLPYWRIFNPFSLREIGNSLVAIQRYSCILDGLLDSHMLTKNVLRAAYGRPKAPINIRYVCCGQRPQHLRGLKKAICGRWLPQFVVALVTIV